MYILRHKFELCVDVDEMNKKAKRPKRMTKWESGKKLCGKDLMNDLLYYDGDIIIWLARMKCWSA